MIEGNGRLEYHSLFADTITVASRGTASEEMPYAKTKAPKGMVFVCPQFCGFQSRPLLNEDVESKANSPYKCPSCGALGSLKTWTRPWYKVDTTWQSLVESFRLVTLPWRRRFCQNCAQYKLVANRRGVYKLAERLEPTVKMQSERGMPFIYSSRSFQGSGWTQVLLCGECVSELAEAGQKLSDDLSKLR